MHGGAQTVQGLLESFRRPHGFEVLGQAVLEANARPGTDEIRLPAFSGSDPLGGTGALVHRLSIPNDVFIGDDENAGVTGDLDISDDVRILGAGSTLTRIR